MRNLALVCLAAALLAGCGTAPTSRAPAPVAEPPPVGRSDGVATPATPAGAGGARTRAYESPAPVRATHVHGKAVTALLESARRQQAAGDLGAAAATVERALRIEPRNGHLWYRLAELRLEQSQYAAAADLAARANALAAGDIPLQRNNWRLIAAARRSAGDAAGARAAERKAQQLY